MINLRGGEWGGGRWAVKILLVGGELNIVS